MTGTGPIVTVTIAPDGSTTVAVSGVSGPGCKALTASVESKLGTVTGTAATPEATQQPAAQPAAQTGGPA